MNRRWIKGAVVFLACAMVALGCNEVTTEKVPTYSINFTGPTSKANGSINLTLTPITKAPTITITNTGMGAAGDLSKAQLFGDDVVEESFPEYCSVLLMPVNRSYNLGFGCEGAFRFRFETTKNPTEGFAYGVEINTRKFWINEGDVFDNYNLISKSKAHVQYITDFNGDGELEYNTGVTGDFRIVRKESTVYDSKNGKLEVEVQLSNVSMPMNGTTYIVSGTVDLVLEVTGN